MKTFAPPPTKFGGQAVGQPKAAQPAIGAQHHAPPTRFGAPKPAQPMAAQPPASHFAAPPTTQPLLSPNPSSGTVLPPPTRYAPSTAQAKSNTGIPLTTRDQTATVAQPMRRVVPRGVIQAMDTEASVIDAGGGDPIIDPAEEAALKDIMTMKDRLDAIGDMGANARAATIGRIDKWMYTKDVLNSTKRQGMIKQIDEAYFAQRRIFSELDKSLKVFDRSNSMPFLSTDNKLHADLTYLSKHGTNAVVMEVKTVSSEENSAVWTNVTNAKDQLVTRCVPGTYGKIRIQIANTNNKFLDQTNAEIISDLNNKVAFWNDDIPVTEVTFLSPDGKSRRFRAQLEAGGTGLRKVKFVANGKDNRVTTVRPKGTHDAMTQRVKDLL